MLEVKNLTKNYGRKEALKDVSFKVEEHDILGFLGVNGSGKSTTMNIITGYLAATSGTVLVDGIDILEHPNKVKKLLGYLPEKPPLYVDMTVTEYLNFVCDLKKVTIDKNTHILEICKLVQIDDVKNRVIKNLSKGYCQRVGIAQALIGYPKLLVLDEPTAGLDPKQIIEIRTLLTELSAKMTIILSSHILSEIQSVCNRVIVINEGAIVADDTAENLTHSLGKTNKITIAIKGAQEDVHKALTKISEVSSVTQTKVLGENVCEYVVECDKEVDIRDELFYALAENKLPIYSLSLKKTSLENIFIALTETTDKTEPPAKTKSSRKVKKGEGQV